MRDASVLLTALGVIDGIVVILCGLVWMGEKTFSRVDDSRLLVRTGSTASEKWR